MSHIEIAESRDGEIVLPEELCEAAGMHPGDVVGVVARPGRIELSSGRRRGRFVRDDRSSWEELWEIAGGNACC